MTLKARRRTDPDRRDRIIDTTLDVIAIYGIEGTTHRRIAQAADVSPGSVTYYFAGMEDLLQEAFTKLCELMSSEFQACLQGITTKEEAVQTVINWASEGTWTKPRNLVLLFELYAFAARTPLMRPLLEQWMNTCATYLSRYFDPATAKTLDAFIDGVILHNVVNRNYITREEITSSVLKLTQ